MVLNLGTNPISSNPKINKELVTTIYSVKVYDKNGNEVTIFDYTPAVFGTGDSVNAKAGDILVPNGSNFNIVQRNHYHAAANGLLGEWKISPIGLSPGLFSNYEIPTMRLSIFLMVTLIQQS